MRNGLVMSSVLHAVLLLASIYSLRTYGLTQPEPLPINIDLASAAELTKLKAGTQKAKQDKPVAAPRPPAKADAPKHTAAAKAKPKPKAAPKKAVKKAAPKRTASLDAKREAEELLGLGRDRKPKPKRKPARRVPRTPPNKAKFDADSIAALLNKVQDKPSPKRSDQQTAARQEPPAKGQDEGRDVAMTISEIDALRARISQCWSPPVAGLEAASTAVKLRLQLNRDGTLARAPELVSNGSSAVFRAAADSAIRAVWQCQPYALPATKYELWQDMILNFDPKEMIGG